jgi:hypothetical protein
MAAENSSGEWPIRFTAESTRTLFVLFTVFWWVGYPLITIAALLPEGLGLLITALTGPLLIAAVVFDCILLYRNWLLLQGHGARTTPGKAVGFCFIPVFFFYWWFVAYAGLARDNNSYMNSAGIDGPRISYGLGVANAIMGILSLAIGWVPVVSLLVDIPSIIVGFLFVIQQKNCILAIMARRQGATT